MKLQYKYKKRINYKRINKNLLNISLLIKEPLRNSDFFLLFVDIRYINDYEIIIVFIV